MENLQQNENDMLNGDANNFDPSELENVLDDKLLDAVTPHLTLLDGDENEPRNSICHRCRSISSSFLTSPECHVCSASFDPIRNSGGNEVCSGSETYPQFYSSNPNEDVPLLGVSIGQKLLNYIIYYS